MTRSRRSDGVRLDPTLGWRAGEELRPGGRDALGPLEAATGLEPQRRETVGPLARAAVGPLGRTGGGTERASLDNIVERGECPFTEFGRDKKVRRSDFEEWLGKDRPEARRVREADEYRRDDF